MPILLAAIPDFIFPEISDGLILAGLGGGAIGGSIASWCQARPGYPGCINTGSSVIDSESVPKIKYLGKTAVGPCNVPLYNFQQCKQQVQAQSARVVSSIPAAGVAQFNNVPPACMDLASVMGGSCNGDGARPVPCGSACMQYTGLSDKAFTGLCNTLNKK